MSSYFTTSTRRLCLAVSYGLASLARSCCKTQRYNESTSTPRQLPLWVQVSPRFLYITCYHVAPPLPSLAESRRTPLAGRKRDVGEESEARRSPLEAAPTVLWVIKKKGGKTGRAFFLLAVRCAPAGISNAVSGSPIPPIPPPALLSSLLFLRASASSKR
ncbi:uncharacterized protein MCYG_06585 [Microsporum canis CBS 113480]|uniref:Uncharacterized protein n=1 Tax=Arthroderma otae (strain ATCC MYA-4605 / CBS 113480) TaxID=554155 RepID=C5FV32_ARTOC|nr:uncharacterized protein MCYG_06585 [Microsporum canis CBS 113480]EEQ33766.1 predicted protein [Microsporum canis CBS 113480]